MKPLNMTKPMLALLFSLMIFASCSSPKELLFSNRDWHINPGFGQMIDRDTTYRFTFGNVILPSNPSIISCKDSLDKYPGMKKFMTDILHSCNLDSAEILCYVPELERIFVKTNGIMSTGKPNSISTPMWEEKPYTMWVHDDDVENWARKDSEMYTYYYFNKRKRQLLIADFFNYGDTPIAQISVYQSKTKKTRKMGVDFSIYLCFCNKDIRNPHKNIEYWANMVEYRRRIAFSNYKIGQEQKNRAK